MTENQFNLKDCLDFFEDSDDFVFIVKQDNGDEATVKFIDEYGISSYSGRSYGRGSSFFVAGFEFGPDVLIHASSFEDAWEEWVDSMETIPEEELIEAYGIVDDYRAEYKEMDPCPNYWEKEKWDAWHVRFYAACKARLKELGDIADATGNDYPELIEGYQMQSNCSGTGIVNMGHYAWMNEADPEDILIRRNEQTKESTLVSDQKE